MSAAEVQTSTRRSIIVPYPPTPSSEFGRATKQGSLPENLVEKAFKDAPMSVPQKPVEKTYPDRASVNPTVETTSATSNRDSIATIRRGHREVRFGAYVLGSTLGEGEFGKVKLGWRKDGQHPSQVAIKLIKRDTLARDSELEVKIHREINSMRLLSHPNIINLVEVLKSGKYIGIVLEYASGGELFEHILQHKHLKENVAKRLFAQLVSGVDYMHLKGLIHRDLKLENLLLDKHKNIVISDFGFVNSYNRSKNDLMKTSCGLPCYAAPELVLTRTPYSGRKVDIWSMGVILYAMLAGYLPFDDDVENEDGADIVRLYNYICTTRLTFPEYVSPLARDLLRRIIVPDPCRRINIDEIRTHPWLALHSTLLSIRQPEWDRMAKDEKLATNPNALAAAQCGQARNKRYSMISETTSSSTLMLSGSKNTYGKSYASSSNIIYSHPTTSSSFANVVATNSDKTPDQVPLGSPSVSSYSGTANEASIFSNSYPYQKSHAKSASISTNQTSASHALMAVASEHDKSLESEQLPAPVTPMHLSRNSTYMGTIPTIAESPTTVEFGAQPRALATPVERLPHTQKKPRPTSYHPGSMSLSFILYNNNSTSTVPDFVRTQTSPTHPYSQYLLSSPTRTLHGIDSSVSISDNGNGSPVLLASVPHRSSRRDSVVTAINVNGVLSNELASHENERNSVLNYLEDKMDTLELSELHSPTRIPLDDSDLPVIRGIPQIPKLQTTLPQPGKATPVIDQLPKFAVTTESPVIAHSDSLLLSKSDENSAVLEDTTRTDLNKTQNSDTQGLGSAASVAQERPAQGSKEVQEQKKKNRFSILSFYGASSFSSYNLANETENVAQDVSSVGKDRRRVESSGSTHSQLRRPMSTISPNTNTTQANAKEASAARKVMNFFKRRSVRIG